MHPEISESERFPRITPDGMRFLHAMRQDPHAPIWNWPNGEQLDDAGLARVREFAERLKRREEGVGSTRFRNWRDSSRISQADPLPPIPKSRRPNPGSNDEPDWLQPFVDFCIEDVPFYRGRSPAGADFAMVPSCSRDDLAARPWNFVPDSAPLDRLIVFSSSGTTGHPAQLPTHPFTAACGIPLIEHALESHGVAFPRGVDRMALTHVADYQGAYTTAIVMSYLDEAGCVRVNLHDEAWRNPLDCTAYVNRWHSPIILGDPCSLATLQKVPLREPPRAIASCILSMSDAFAAELSTRYGCPVLDLYAMTEAGIIAVRTPDPTGAHRVMPHDLYVEVLDENDEPCPPGVRGEIALTGGRNPFAPLLRYRTGDYASLEQRDGETFLVGLEGRDPVVFRTADDRIVHGIEVSRAVRSFPLVQFQLAQDADGRFRFRYRGAADESQLRDALAALLGDANRLQVETLEDDDRSRRKLKQYVSEFV